MPGLLRNEIEVLRLAGAQYDFGLVGIQHRRVADLGGFEEIGGVELMELLAAVFDMQAIGNAAAKGELVRGEFRLRRDDRDQLRLIGGKASVRHRKYGQQDGDGGPGQKGTASSGGMVTRH